MTEIITGHYSEAGVKGQNSDYTQAFAFVRPNGDQLSVAIVADGGQNGATGQMLAQIAVNGVITYLKQQFDETISQALINAVLMANRLVKQSFQSIAAEDKKGCSLAVAVVVNNERLYIANVGGCQIYMVRNQKLHQLTVDHNFKNVATFSGKMDYETAACNPAAENIVRAIGLSSKIEVDIGFHVGMVLSENSYALAQHRGRKGVPIKSGDSILVASDGLKTSVNVASKNLIQENEMLRVLNSQKGDRSARGLVSFALGRGADDDISAAVLQAPQEVEEKPPFVAPQIIRQNTAIAIGGIATLLLIVCIATIVLFDRRTRQVALENVTPVQLASLNDQSNTDLNQADSPTAEASPSPLPSPTDSPTAVPTAMPTATELPPPPTATPVKAEKQQPAPTPTLRPTQVPFAVGIYRLGNEREYPIVWDDQQITVDQNAEFQINHQQTTAELIHKLQVLPDENTIRDASLYALNGSSLEFTQVDEQVELRLYDNSDILLHTGFYDAGAKIEVRTSSEDVTFNVVGSCMAVVYREDKQMLHSYCFEGDCQYKVGRWEPGQIPEGQRATFDPQNASAPPTFSPITQNVAQLYQSNLLLNFFSGIEDSASCLAPYLGNMGMMNGATGD